MPSPLGAGSQIGASSTAWTVQADVAAVGVAITLILFVATRVRDRRVRQAELLRNYTNDFYGDTGMTSIFMKIDHGRYRFSPARHGGEEELALIRILDFFNVIGHNWSRGVMRLDTLIDTTLGYAATRLHNDKYVSEYLKQIERWDSERYAAGTGFGHFRELAVVLQKYPPAPVSGSVVTRARAALRRKTYARSARLRLRVRAPLPRSVAATTAELNRITDSTTG